MGANDLSAAEGRDGYLSGIARTLFKNNEYTALADFLAKSTPEEIAEFDPVHIYSGVSYATARLPANYVASLARVLKGNDAMERALIGGFQEGLTSFLDMWQGSSGDALNLVRLEAAVRAHEKLSGVLEQETLARGLFLVHRDQKPDIEGWNSWNVTVLLDRDREVCCSFAQYQNSFNITPWEGQCSNRSWVSDAALLKMQIFQDLAERDDPAIPEWVQMRARTILEQRESGAAVGATLTPRI
jgi:hypothetical protein